MDIDSVTDGRWMGGMLCRTAAWNRAECCPPSQPGSLEGPLCREGGLSSQVERKSLFYFWGLGRALFVCFAIKLI